VSGDVDAMVTMYDDLEAVSLAAAGLFAVEARRAAAGEGRFDVLLSGGATPRRCYELLGDEPLKSTIPWDKVQLFWGDERHVPHDDPRSNFAMVRDALLQRVPLSRDQVHPIPYAASAAASALAYEELLQEHFHPAPPRFHLAFLGLGDNGHTASLFPGTPVLNETVRWVREVYVAEQDLYRVTLTPPLLNSAALVAFLVSGAEKAGILRQVLEGAHDPQRIPAQLIRPAQGRVLWLVDRPAAQLLSQATID
jgi:6-phosphogluconolactonase